MPAVGGSSRIASPIVSGSTGWLNDTMNFVSNATRVPKGAVGMIEAVVASRVRKTERAGRASG